MYLFLVTCYQLLYFHYLFKLVTISVAFLDHICFNNYLQLVHCSFNLLGVYFDDTGVFLQLLYTLLWTALSRASLSRSTVNPFVKQSVAIGRLTQRTFSFHVGRNWKQFWMKTLTIWKGHHTFISNIFLYRPFIF